MIFLAVLLIAAWGTQAAKEGCVTVTGASGFMAGHLIEELLQKGYHVKGTVRSLKKKSKYEHLLKLDEKHKGKLELIEADLEKDAGFDKALEGCYAVLHTASPVLPEDGRFLEAAVDGTTRVLKLALDMPKIETVVLTSSVATLGPTSKKPDGVPITEEDNNDIARADYGPYAYSKVRAEQRAKEMFEEARKAGKKLPRYTSIHFSYAIGPQQSTRVTSSNQGVRMLLNGELPFALPSHFSSVDVRDVARAHVHVLEDKRAQGRYIVSNAESESFRLIELADMLRKEFPTCAIPTFEIPVEVAQLIQYVDKRLDRYMVDVSMRGRKHNDGSKITRELGFEYKYPRVRESVVAAGRSMVEMGIVSCTSDKVLKQQAILFGVPLVLLLLFYLLLRCCCFRKKASRKPKAE
eukprot:Sspe_Gene.56518::Locus_31096_Transcript_1_1_Confidence_1.000_Length_1430::g.56518::m.56518